MDIVLKQLVLTFNDGTTDEQVEEVRKYLHHFLGEAVFMIEDDEDTETLDEPWYDGLEPEEVE